MDSHPTLVGGGGGLRLKTVPLLPLFLWMLLHGWQWWWGHTGERPCNEAGPRRVWQSASRPALAQRCERMAVATGLIAISSALSGA